MARDEATKESIFGRGAGLDNGLTAGIWKKPLCQLGVGFHQGSSLLVGMAHYRLMVRGVNNLRMSALSFKTEGVLTKVLYTYLLNELFAHVLNVVCTCFGDVWIWFGHVLTSF